MQIVDNKALVLRTRNPDKYKVIPRMAVVGESEGIYEVAVKWGLDEVAVLRNLGVRDVPSPIIARYNWPGRYKPVGGTRLKTGFHSLTTHRRAFVFSEPGYRLKTALSPVGCRLPDEGWARAPLLGFVPCVNHAFGVDRRHKQQHYPQKRHRSPPSTSLSTYWDGAGRLRVCNYELRRAKPNCQRD